MKTRQFQPATHKKQTISVPTQNPSRFRSAHQNQVNFDHLQKFHINRSTCVRRMYSLAPHIIHCSCTTATLSILMLIILLYFIILKYSVYMCTAPRDDKKPKKCRDGTKRMQKTKECTPALVRNRTIPTSCGLLSPPLWKQLIPGKNPCCWDPKNKMGKQWMMCVGVQKRKKQEKKSFFKLETKCNMRLRPRLFPDKKQVGVSWYYQSNITHIPLRAL